MILVDTSIWIDHLRVGDKALSDLLEATEVAIHPLVLGELAVGSIRGRETFLGLLRQLPNVPVADTAEVLAFVDTHALHGQGLGIVDVHLLASTLLTPDGWLWTRDARLRKAAAALGVSWQA